MTSDTEYTYSSGLIYVHIYFIYLLLYILTLHYKERIFQQHGKFLIVLCYTHKYNGHKQVCKKTKLVNVIDVAFFKLSSQYVLHINRCTFQ